MTRPTTAVSTAALANCSAESTAATYTVPSQSAQFEGIFPKVGTSSPSLTISDLRCDSAISIFDYVQPGPNSVFVTTMLYDRVTATECAASTAEECVGELENFRFVALPPDLSLHVHHSWSTYWGHQEVTPLVCLQDASAGVEAVTVVEGLSCDHPLSAAGEPYTKLFLGDLLLDAGIPHIDARNTRGAAPSASDSDAQPTYRMSGAEILAVMHYQTTGQADVAKWGWYEDDMSDSVRVMLETREVPGVWSSGEPLKSTTSGGQRRETLRTGINVRFEPQGSVSVFSGRALLDALLRTFAAWAILKAFANLIAFRYVSEGDVYSTWRERHIDQRGAQTGRVPTEGTGAQAVELSRSIGRARSASHARGGRKTGADSSDSAPLTGGRKQGLSRADSSDFAFADRMESDKASRKRGTGKINRTAAAVPREITAGAGESKGSFSFGATPTTPTSGGGGGAESMQSYELENRVAELSRRVAELDATMTSYMDSTKETLRQLSADVTHHEQLLLLKGGTARSGMSPSQRLERGVQDPSDTNLNLEAAGLTQDTGQESEEYANLLTTTPRGTRTLVPTGSLRGRDQFGTK